MNISFPATPVTTRFNHLRSETEIVVTGRNTSALITFIDDDQKTAELEISNKTDLARFLDAISRLDEMDHKEVSGFFDTNTHIVLTVDYDVYGEPYEKCIKFTFTQADSDREWDPIEISACLNRYREKEFISTLKNIVT